MALVATDWTITRATKVIAYIGDGHTGVNPSYVTGIEFHRWVQGLADDALAVGDDQLDISNTDPSRRSTDNIITLINGYTISQATSEHIYDSSIIQGTSGSDIWDGIVNFGNAGVLVQIQQVGAVISDDWWNYSVGGTQTGATNATVVTDSALATALSNRSLGASDLIGYTIYNTTDGSFGIITANTTGTITVAAGLFGGTLNTFTASDAYKIGIGVNRNAVSGISHRFMVKVRTTSADIDNRKLLGTNRRYGFTYGEFSINATSRGNNVLALSDSEDLNNTTDFDTVSAWADVLNTEGYALIDVNNDTVDEAYYSEWDKGAKTINQFYEYTKAITADGVTATTLTYALAGELFRGITHEVAVSGQGVTDFIQNESLSWGTGATAGTGQLLAVDDVNAATTIWIQLLTGVTPTGTITANGGATVTAGVITERPVATPFVGASTGSALIGAYGLGVEKLDLAATDKVKDLTNTVITPPNNVTNTVAGLISGEDRVLVAPWDGTTTDVNGDPAVEKTQFYLSTSLTTANITSVVIKIGTEGTATIPTDTPATGTIRVTDDNGFERRLKYTSWTGSTFTVNPTTSEADIAGVADFDVVAATVSGDNLPVWISYIDEIALGTLVTAASGFTIGVTYVIETVGTTDFVAIGAASDTVGVIFTATGVGSGTGDARIQATSSTFTSVQSGSRDLVVLVRDGDTTPIKQFISAWSQTSAPQTITAIRTTDA